MNFVTFAVQYLTQMLFEEIERLGHEQVILCNDPETGLRAIIAIHDTTIGPALGGTRLWTYKTTNDAVIDALRLSRGMTYKAAISGLNLGGGKAVIIGDPSMKSEAFWRRYGKFVDSLGGKYITAEDVNTSADDMRYISMETEHVTGVPHYLGGSGDPSPYTAYGVFCGMRAGAKIAFGEDSLSGKKVLVQGVGHVGQYLVAHLLGAGANVMISDINESKIKETEEKYPDVELVDNDHIFDLEMDIYAPCALGATLNDESIPKLKAKLVAGAANNQLARESIHDQMLLDRDIVYVPDFMLNAGGLINVAAEISGYNEAVVNADVERIYDRTLEIFSNQKEWDLTPQFIALRMAQNRIDSMAKLKSKL